MNEVFTPSSLRVFHLSFLFCFYSFADHAITNSAFRDNRSASNGLLTPRQSLQHIRSGFAMEVSLCNSHI